MREKGVGCGGEGHSSAWYAEKTVYEGLRKLTHMRCGVCLGHWVELTYRPRRKLETGEP